MPTTREEIDNYVENIFTPANNQIQKVVERLLTVSKNLGLLHECLGKLTQDLKYIDSSIKSGHKIKPVMLEIQLTNIKELLKAANVAKAQWDYDQKFMTDFLAKRDELLSKFKDTVNSILSKPANASPDINDYLNQVKDRMKIYQEMVLAAFNTYDKTLLQVKDLAEHHELAVAATCRLFSAYGTPVTSTPLPSSPSSSDEKTASTASIASSLNSSPSSSYNSNLSAPSSTSSSPSASPVRPAARPTTPSLGSGTHTHFAATPNTTISANQPADQTATVKSPKKRNGGCNIL